MRFPRFQIRKKKKCTKTRFHDAYNWNAQQRKKIYLTVIGKNSQIFVCAQTKRVNVEKNVDKNNEQIKIAVVSIRRNIWPLKIRTYVDTMGILLKEFIINNNKSNERFVRTIH